MGRGNECWETVGNSCLSEGSLLISQDLSCCQEDDIPLGEEWGDARPCIHTPIPWGPPIDTDHAISAVVCILLCAREQLWHFQALLVASDGWPHVSALTHGRPGWGQTSDGSA